MLDAALQRTCLHLQFTGAAMSAASRLGSMYEWLSSVLVSSVYAWHRKLTTLREGAREVR